MLNQSQHYRGFTLVELMIVVMIIGLLAIIAIPRFSEMTGSANGTNMMSQLQTIRTQLELYKLHHSGGYPELNDVNGDGKMWDRLTLKTDFAGDITANGEFGPYLMDEPDNPFVKTSVVSNEVGEGVAWYYDQTLGKVQAVLPDSVDPANLGLNPGDYVMLGAAEEE